MFTKPSIDLSTSIKNEHQESSVHDDVETVVGPSVTVEGDFASEGRILVKGTVCGSVATSKLLTVEVGAKILAN
ncbi:polymer-forming cytoskeletal protein, partial [Patescibacteria group bacterium]|nr:polymer-forming cytoskeletal protein [Patescibacteria group bacterium]